ncbi:MAG TPA: PilZ domain-containing protein [Acidimicrobiia bacterium]
MFGRKRRSGRRESAGWLGRYVPVESSGRDWSRCRVLDVSTGGAGLELLGPGDQAGALVGDRVVVDLQLVRSNMARVTLTGEVRHATRIPVGVRVGLRFVDVGELERALLDRLVARQKHERRNPGVVTPLERSR